ncbi:MAG: hypothetical protein EOO04_24050 [Chitinophagaceae bacterium]|nr:MAG: hypothetical protein EOO04_24050 [Chitinophagaceae bacterium]
MFISILSFFFFTAIFQSQAQCSICTKTAQQMGEGPGRGLNAGILYLAAAPILILGIIGYKWYQSNRAS